MVYHNPTVRHKVTLRVLSADCDTPFFCFIIADSPSLVREIGYTKHNRHERAYDSEILQSGEGHGHNVLVYSSAMSSFLPLIILEIWVRTAPSDILKVLAVAAFFSPMSFMTE